MKNEELRLTPDEQSKCVNLSRDLDNPFLDAQIQKLMDKGFVRWDREIVASHFMVVCEDCFHGENLTDDCPHEDKDICLWQLELADSLRQALEEKWK